MKEEEESISTDEHKSKTSEDIRKLANKSPPQKLKSSNKGTSRYGRERNYKEIYLKNDY